MNYLGPGPGAKGHCFFGWTCLQSSLCLSPVGLRCPWCCVLPVLGASSHGRLGFFKYIVSAGTGTVFGLEHGWCGVTNKIRVEG